ncbi:Mitochondrial arginine transporter BAC2 [Abeliophyllum distichum]|uniref:Mitochondrial arginine transporter BAC2 n=1 Tax=Abeliophyllum distichum TaxID=126358 RepID=A0ABD1VA99_9LAMI
MEFWPEFLASSWGKEFVAGGLGGTAGIVAGYPLDTLRILQQNSKTGSAFSILRRVVASDGLCALYRGMAAPLASVSFQNAMAFQTYAILSRAFSTNNTGGEPPSYKGVALGGIGTGAIQSLLLSPVELIKIRLQLQGKTNENKNQSGSDKGPIHLARKILRTEGWRGIYRGLTITVLRDAPAHGVYFWTYEFIREQLHPGCRKSGKETLRTMLVAGGLAGVASWIFCYPLDVMKTRIQAQPKSSPTKYKGIADCFKRSVKEEGYSVLWRGLGTAVARAFLVNGAVFTGYETALSIVGLHKIKIQLEKIVEKIISAENDASYSFRVVPPKPFHMVFVGNTGTGKSTVARILGKLFYLSGALPSYDVIETGLRGKMKTGDGGILLVDIDERDLDSNKLEEIISVMDEEETSVIFAGNRMALNQSMKLNKELYKRFSASLLFEDFTCEELAMIIEKKMNDQGEDSPLRCFELDAFCNTDNIAKVIAEESFEELRSELNAYLVDQILLEAKTCLEKRVGSKPETTISLKDLGMGIRNATQIYKKLLCM